MRSITINGEQLEGLFQHVPTEAPADSIDIVEHDDGRISVGVSAGGAPPHAEFTLDDEGELVS